MKVALIQFNAKDNKDDNVHRAVVAVKKAASRGATFILLPEVFNYRGLADKKLGYVSVAESLRGGTVKVFKDIAKKSSANILLGSIYEVSKNRSKVYNTSVLIDKHGCIKSAYRKMNLFDAVIKSKALNESVNFLPGRRLASAKVGNFKVGLSICYDLRFPKMFRKYAAQGVDVICVPAAFTHATGKAHWEVLLRARAIESLSYVLAPNQIGTDARGVRYYGNSMIVSPWGEVVARGSTNKEEIVLANIDKKAIKEARKILPAITK